MMVMVIKFWRDKVDLSKRLKRMMSLQKKIFAGKQLENGDMERTDPLGSVYEEATDPSVIRYDERIGTVRGLSAMLCTYPGNGGSGALQKSTSLYYERRPSLMGRRDMVSRSLSPEAG
ncbi:hypothetical protein ACLOJK_036905 [Asimina triloba]